MTLNDLKGLQMSVCVSNKLIEVIWSHLRSFGAIEVMRQQNWLYFKNAMLLKNALSFFCQSVIEMLEIVGADEYKKTLSKTKF